MDSAVPIIWARESFRCPYPRSDLSRVKRARFQTSRAMHASFDGREDLGPFWARCGVRSGPRNFARCPSLPNRQELRCSDYLTGGMEAARWVVGGHLEAPSG